MSSSFLKVKNFLEIEVVDEKSETLIPRLFHFVTEIIAWYKVTIIYSLTLSSLKYQCIGNLVHVCKATLFCGVQRLVFFFGFVK